MTSRSSKFAVRVFISLIAVLFVARATLATTAALLTDEQLITSSRVVLIGEVKFVKSQWDLQLQNINSYVKVRVEKTLKGELQNEHIVFKQPGGTIGDQSTVIFGAPEYKIGQRVLLFLDTAGDGTLRIAHLFQGKYDVIVDQTSGKTRVERKLDDAVNIVGPREGTEITNEARLSKFTRRIDRTLREKAADVAEYAAQYGDVPIVEIPPEYLDDPTGEPPAGDISPEYTFLNNFRWFEPDSALPVTFRVNPNGSPIAGGGNSEINQALAAWTNVQTTALALQNGGSTTALGFQADGVTAVSYNDPLDQMSDPVGCSGTLAIGGISRGGSSTRIIGGQSFRQILEGDVVFNRNFSCFLGISANLAEVATHEIGHAIGFGHSADPNAIMYARAHGQGRGATLASDDISAVSFLYPGSKSTQRFTDVPPSHPYYSYIEKIAQRGITVGCSATQYCPDSLVTRDQMAVFIERALGVFSPPTPPSQRFADVPTNHWAYRFIGDLASRGITAGCTSTTYCPNAVVTRDQMAVFMERAVGRPNPPFPSGQRFVDVPPSYWSFSFVDSFIQHGLSAGIMDVIKRDCNADGLHFCPGKSLTRAEMAAWLVIAFEL